MTHYFQINKRIPTRKKLKNFLFSHKIKNQIGFTLFEIMVAISLFLITILIVTSMYIFAQRSYNKGSEKAELTQNARVTLDRLTRELRQAADIVTTLPSSANDPLFPAPQEINFRDGHNTASLTYFRYYLDGTNLMRQHKAYYFSNEPDIYVTWNSIDQIGNPPVEDILEDEIVGEYFNDVKFWGLGNEINLSLNLNKGQTNLWLETAIHKRN